MRKLIFVIFLLPLFVYSQDIVDYYPESNYNIDEYLYNGSNTAWGQSFTCSSETTLYSAKFYVKKIGWPGGYAYAKLYGLTGTYGTTSKPIGSAVATSDPYLADNIPTYLSLIEFTFSDANQITLYPGYYGVSIEFSGGSSASVCLKVGEDVTSSTHSGNNFRYYNGSWLNGSSGRDMLFYVYGISATSGYTHIVNTVDPDNIAKVNSVGTENIQSINSIDK